MFLLDSKFNYVVYNSVMELANLSVEAAELVRVAKKEDAGTIMRLLQQAAYTHYHVDWRLPADWIGDEGFVVYLEKEGQARRWGSWGNGGLAGCLAVAADPPPAAWVRVASIATRERPELVLATMLAAVLPGLQKTAVSQLAWLAVEEWPDNWLAPLGFYRISQLETYIKRQMSIPSVAPSLHPLTFRPAQLDDLATLADIEAAAYAPLWRHSSQALAHAFSQAFSFDVIEVDGRIIGFQLSTRSGYNGAHLARMTIRPEWQQQGVGSALLTHTLQQYQTHGIRHVSLNTQVENIASQRLYKKFGFQANGERLPIWCLDICEVGRGD